MNKIENDKQLEITRAWVKHFEDCVREAREADEEEVGIDPRIKKAVVDGLISQLEDLKEQVRDYMLEQEREQYKGS